MQTTRDVPKLTESANILARPFTRSFYNFARDIKLLHSAFALPFAASAFLFLDTTELLDALTLRKVILLIGCMIGARSFAMGFNRFADRHIDRVNPRTKVRQIPSGGLAAGHGLMWTIMSGLLLVIGAFLLSPLAGWLSLPLMMVLAGYSFGKHLTLLVHWYLGVCLGFAPVAVQIALVGKPTTSVLLIGTAVAFWTAGFDILYSLQDMVFDRKMGLKSVPARFGTKGALIISRMSFTVMAILLSAAGVMTSRGVLYFSGVAVVSGILAYEHWIVRHTDKSGNSPNINAAFFNWNAAVSIIFFIMALADVLWAGGAGHFHG